MQVSDTNNNRGAHGVSSFKLDGLSSSSENPPALAVGSVNRFGSEFTVGCYLAENNDPETAISTVEKWGEENKIKTNAQVFEEVFGVVPYVGLGLDSKENSQIGIKESLREIGWWGEEFKGTVYDSKD